MKTLHFFKKRFLALCLILVACSSATLVAPSQVLAQSDSLSPNIFEPIVSSLPQGIPPRLPTYIPTGGVNRSSLVASLVIKSENAYQIAIGSPSCQGANSCRYATVSGERTNSATPSIESQFTYMNSPRYKPTRRSPDPMGYVTLANGIRGYFVPWVLGANYSDAKVIWNENSYRYLVGVKGGSKEVLVQMASSAIQQVR